MDLNLLSRTRASGEGVRHRAAQKSRDPLARALWGSWEDRRPSHCLQVGPSCSASSLPRISPLSHPAGRRGDPDLTLHIASPEGGPFPSDPSKPQAESCTSGTLWRVFEAPQEPLCQFLPSQPPPRTHANSPRKGLGLLGAKGPHTKSFHNS